MDSDVNTSNLGPLDNLDSDGIAHTTIEAARAAENSRPLTWLDYQAGATWEGDTKVIP